MSNEVLELKAQLLGSLLLFTRTFFKIRTGREFVLSQPVSAESHFITICRDLTKVGEFDESGQDLLIRHLLINCPPGWAKSELCKHYIAWKMAHYPDSQFMYISYGVELAAKHTHGIKQIIELPAYKKLFGIEVASDSSAKDDFKTNYGGAVKAFGLNSGITGFDAGLPNCGRFSGAALIDDAHKPDEVHSDTMRATVIRQYQETVIPRLRSPIVPIIFIGQRLHEKDLGAFIIEGKDGLKWDKRIIKALDVHNNPLYPEVNPLDRLMTIKKFQPYVFASQYMQDPQPAGGGIFKEEWFHIHDEDEDPPIFATFLTCDTAETDKSYNDATVFSFWGIYRTKETDELALEWIDCEELRVEPHELQSEFMDFYVKCCRYPIKPQLIAIEKKSTGVTLISVLKKVQGLQVKEIERTKASGNKTTRFLEIQDMVAKGLISFKRYSKHMAMCIKHCGKITANNTHANDDIADTLYDAAKIALIDKYISSSYKTKIETSAMITNIAQQQMNVQKLREAQYYGSR